MPNILGTDGNDQDIYIHSSHANTDADPAESLETVADELTSIRALFPATLGAKASAGSVSVVLATDQSALDLNALPTGTNSIGQVTANAGTNLNTSALALEDGGNLEIIANVLAANISANVLSNVEPPSKQIRFATGVLTAAGDTTAIDISSLTGYSTGDRIVFSSIRIQNNTGSANTITLKDGSTAISTVITELAGSGTAEVYPISREPKLTADNDLVINLLNANNVTYSIQYYLES